MFAERIKKAKQYTFLDPDSPNVRLESEISAFCSAASFDNLLNRALTLLGYPFLPLHPSKSADFSSFRRSQHF
jgi:hypothetical protein